jgi:hypothetical protein
VKVVGMDADCAALLNPLGAAHPADGTTISQDPETGYDWPFLRAFAWDRSLIAPVQYYSHVDATGVTLHVKNADTPMLITGNDGVHCDVQPDEAATKVTLFPVTAVEGQGYRWAKTDFQDDPACPESAAVEDNDTDTAKQLCDLKSDMFRVARHVADPEPTAVYAIGPLAGDICTGNYYQLPGGPGWKCVVATASDGVGNVSVSEPLRVCVDDGSGACSSEPPACTDGCELREIFVNPRSVNGMSGVPEAIVR